MGHSQLIKRFLYSALERVTETFERRHHKDRPNIVALISKKAQKEQNFCCDLKILFIHLKYGP